VAYIEGLAIAAGHEDRHEPLKNYCKALLLPGERKSIEPMAARLDPTKTREHGSYSYDPVVLERPTPEPGLSHRHNCACGILAQHALSQK
jgi:SRSO17 transposase